MLAQLDPTGVWESTANRSPEASFFHTPYWARILSKTFPGKYQIATKTFKRSDGTVAVLPMMGAGFELKGFFGSYLSNPLGVYGGFISESPISGEEFQKLVERLQWVRAKRVELFGNPFAEQPSSSCPSWETRQNFTQVIRLDNAASQSELTGRYTHLMRNHINRAMRRGYRVRLATLESEVERYHAIYEEAIKRYGNNATSLYPVELFLNIFREGPDRSPIWLVLDNERVVGGAICFIHNGIWTAWNAAFLSEEFPYGVAKFLHNELIMEAYRRGLRYYDFNPSGGHEGTVIFKEMFGAEKRHFVEMRWIGSNLYRQYRAMRSFPSRLSAGAQAPAAAEPAPAAVDPINVAHFRTPYLSRTETFIHNILKNQGEPFVPFVFTDRIQNLDAFPIPRIVDYSIKPMTTLRVMNTVANVLFGDNVWHYSRLLRHHKIRLIHAHFGPQGWAVSQVARRLRIPLITTFYGFDASSLARQDKWKERYQQLFKLGDAFLVEGPHMRRNLISLGCSPEKAWVHRIGVDVHAIRYRQRQAKAAGETVKFLFCGRFIEKKGLIHALQAFDRLVTAGVTNFEFRVIGDGPLRPQAEGFLGGKELARHVTLLGSLSHAQFLDELQTADVMVAPSVTSSDGNTEGGAPTTILEAEAAGLPIVATQHADIPNVVVPGGSALLSPEGDAVALAENIRFMIEHPEKWAEFGRAGRAFVEIHHDVRATAAQLERLYDRLIRDRAIDSRSEGQ